ncbi:sugar ABC transporter substrate-binding protein [Caldibacillus lycopersici]|uniref:Sugar ABC transporter substrate-binding protein n=1 Tax=Perspicuibacillus lycopersici TaxID=1325689 RepID=A0AAE3LSS5_9BACI|nr:sugar ABC transporter substrate-binding protein [Perspicuibacillus lycopersici]MCU9613063.1 sugar ABC transporter substrate-binding protein [Perspicuibacillus lycopersici]
MRKSILIKSMVFLIAIAFVLTGCNSSKSSSTKLEDARYTVDENTPAWKLDTKEDTELTWYVNAEWWNTDYGNDTITRKLKEDLNLNVKFLSGDDTKLNTYFAGKDLPDIITIFGGNTKAALDADSWALPLNELADKYDPYFYKVAQQQTLDWYKLEDGNTYGYPSYSNTQEHYDSGAIPGNDAFIIRQDIYEAIGKPSMSTPEEFLSALGKIKQQFPDVIPFGFKGFSAQGDAGSLGGTFQNHIGVPIATEDGKWYDRNLDEDYLSWVKVFNEAYKLGYLSDDTFSDDGTLFEEKVANGQYATVMAGGVAQLYTALQKNLAAAPEQKYVAIDGPKSTVGHEPTLSQSGISGWSVTYISKDVKDPAKAIQLYTYLLSDEGQYLTTFGVEGETFEFNEDGKAVLLPEVTKLQAENPDEYKTKYRMGEFWFFGHDTFKVEHGVSEPLESVDQIKEWGTPYLKPQFLIENIDPDQGTAEARSLTNINAQWATTLATLLRAGNDDQFNQILDDYRKFLDDNNFDAIVDIRNEKMEQNKEKLGLK